MPAFEPGNSRRSHPADKHRPRVGQPSGFLILPASRTREPGRQMQRRITSLALLFGLAPALATGLPAFARAPETPGQVLAFYYGWYGARILPGGGFIGRGSTRTRGKSPTRRISRNSAPMTATIPKSSSAI